VQPGQVEERLVAQERDRGRQELPERLRERVERVELRDEPAVQRLSHLGERRQRRPVHVVAALAGDEVVVGGGVPGERVREQVADDGDARGRVPHREGQVVEVGVGGHRQVLGPVERVGEVGVDERQRLPDDAVGVPDGQGRAAVEPGPGRGVDADQRPDRGRAPPPPSSSPTARAARRRRGRRRGCRSAGSACRPGRSTRSSGAAAATRTRPAGPDDLTPRPARRPSTRARRRSRTSGCSRRRRPSRGPPRPGRPPGGSRTAPRWRTGCRPPPRPARPSRPRGRGAGRRRPPRRSLASGRRR
jgi:hypothetical protein